MQALIGYVRASPSYGPVPVRGIARFDPRRSNTWRDMQARPYYNSRCDHTPRGGVAGGGILIVFGLAALLPLPIALITNPKTSTFDGPHAHVLRSEVFKVLVLCPLAALGITLLALVIRFCFVVVRSRKSSGMRPSISSKVRAFAA